MLRFAMLLLMGLWVTLTGAADLQPAKVAEQGMKKSTNEPVPAVASEDRKPIAKQRTKAPPISKDPKASPPLLDDKNLGLGCADPS